MRVGYNNIHFLLANYQTSTFHIDRMTGDDG